MLRSLRRDLHARDTPAPEKEASVPLVLDFDGTFVREDSLRVALKALSSGCRRTVLFSQFPPNRVELKRLAFECAPDLLNLLTVNPAVEELALSYVAERRQVFLCTGAHQTLAQEVARRWGFFSDAWGSSELLNLTGRKKANFLIQAFGTKAFDYVGNSRRDYPVFDVALSAFKVSPDGTVARLQDKSHLGDKQ